MPNDGNGLAGYQKRRVKSTDIQFLFSPTKACFCMGTRVESLQEILQLYNYLYLGRELPGTEYYLEDR